jgi:DNA (cytosine-5)-methyltransferase 1
MPRLLDLFCGEGGAALGYLRAGWEVTGVDNRASCGRHYPGTFVHGDALAYLVGEGHRFDAIHASPPCQRFTHGNVAGQQAQAHPDLVTPTRRLLGAYQVPWVIENVPRALAEAGGSHQRLPAPRFLGAGR